jgi:hypothetical protein
MVDIGSLGWISERLWHKHRCYTIGKIFVVSFGCAAKVHPLTLLYCVSVLNYAVSLVGGLMMLQVSENKVTIPR